MRYKKADKLGCSPAHFQSNSEGSLIDQLQERHDRAEASTCNPSGLAKCVISPRETLHEAERDLTVTLLSNAHVREERRRKDFFAEVSDIYAVPGWDAAALGTK